MATVNFTQNIQRHVKCPETDAGGGTVREVLDAVFGKIPRARGYILDEQGALRKHMVIFLNGTAIEDRDNLSDPVAARDEIYIMQALSGG